MQLTLFGQTPPPAKAETCRIPMEKHEVKTPWGNPDGKGNLFWQKMHRELEKLPERYREFFNYVTSEAKPEDLDGLEKCLRMFNKASEFDRIDFDESRGRL